MPELPEVETIRQGLARHLEGRTVTGLTVRQPILRWEVPVVTLQAELVGQTIQTVERRGRYLLIGATKGWMILHLGMSGSLCLLTGEEPWRTHDHLEWILDGASWLRFNDPRRFGAVLWTRERPERHPLLVAMGPEPLEATFDSASLQRSLLNRQTPIKVILMDNHVVAGVGNIYANEALHQAGIHPGTPGGLVSDSHCRKLVAAIKMILQEAITQGGTTLRDFVNSEGRPGYFQQFLRVYGRAGQPCLICGDLIQKQAIRGRSSYFCPDCQPRLGATG